MMDSIYTTQHEYKNIYDGSGIIYNAKEDYHKENLELDMIYKETNHERKNVAIYAVISILCFGFAKVYNLFSHGVYSPFMTYMFLAPLVLGWLPALIGWLVPKLRNRGLLCRNLWHSGVAAITASSLLRGIFEIAGTASIYQSYLMMAGFGFLGLGAIAYLLKK